MHEHAMICASLYYLQTSGVQYLSCSNVSAVMSEHLRIVMGIIRYEQEERCRMMIYYHLQNSSMMN
jgi:hypothetical protein